MPGDLRQPRRPQLAHLDLEDTPERKPRGITALTVTTPTSLRPRQTTKVPPAPRWKTPEFLFYGLVHVVVLPFLFKVPMDMSNPSNPNYITFKGRLSPGWIGGRQVDNSDRQYRSFRDNITALVLLSSSHITLGALYSWFTRSIPSLRPNDASQVPFTAVFSLLMLIGLHGSSSIKIVIILAINYGIAKALKGSPAAPFATWCFNMVILFMNELHDGYKFAAIHPGLEILDSMRGFYPRWNVSFNITMLRLVSFSMDYYWACRNPKNASDISPAEEKERAKTSHALNEYNFTNYFAYAIYPPLYLTGPIMTFNNFMWQMRKPLNIPLRGTVMYLVRFIACFMTMELILHYMYVVAIKDTKAWWGGTPAQIGLVGFWNLVVVWLKLLIPWRFFRLWALAAGVDAPENMVRCVANNYSVLGFWRSWHRSYNIWLTRYLYVPLGGSTRPIVSTLFVFTFVALWHDLSFNLLAWGWLASLFVIPELSARHFVPASKFGERPWHRHAAAVGGVFNLLMLMIANLVGFVVGVDGMKHMTSELFGTVKGLRFLAFACSCLFIAVQVMFEYREEEMRRGIYRRC
ncbi:glycerol transporter [Tulasnella sp. JGI-2019a]|nr:glycerol transporter [Tulasnella sp. JGI-2019a]